MAAPSFPPCDLRTRADVERLLASVTNYEQHAPDGPHALDLGRMRRLLASIGAPHRGPRTTHVAGSKGKGSTVRMIAAGLRASGRGPVGLYTSPHLSDLAERIEIDGAPLDDAALVRAFSALLPALRAASDAPSAPTFFELFTAAAWWAFRERGCREVVLETGLGGRLDATTVCEPAVTVITTIELEHTTLLGDTLERIAAEKAGIVKPGVPCLTGAVEPALGVIAARARALGAPLEALGRDILLEDVRVEPGPRTHARLRLGGETHELTLPLAGAHQARNAALALGALRRLDVPAATARAALGQVRLPAALEPFGARPTVVLDGAHTPASARAAREALAAAFPGRPLVVLVALMADKRVDEILEALLPGAVAVTATAVESPRALEAGRLAQACRQRTTAPVAAVEGPQAALEAARRAAPADAVLLVAGSLYLAGALRPGLLQEAGAGR